MTRASRSELAGLGVDAKDGKVIRSLVGNDEQAAGRVDCEMPRLPAARASEARRDEPTGLAIETEDRDRVVPAVGDVKKAPVRRRGNLSRGILAGPAYGQRGQRRGPREAPADRVAVEQRHGRGEFAHDGAEAAARDEDGMALARAIGEAIGDGSAGDGNLPPVERIGEKLVPTEIRGV